MIRDRAVKACERDTHPRVGGDTVEVQNDELGLIAVYVGVDSLRGFGQNMPHPARTNYGVQSLDKHAVVLRTCSRRRCI